MYRLHASATLRGLPSSGGRDNGDRTLVTPFLFCSLSHMERERLSLILQNAPAWARLGLTVRDPRLRERASDALAATIVQGLDEQVPVNDRNQLALPL